MDSPPEHVDDVVQARDAEPDEPPLLQTGQHQCAESEHALRGEVVDRQRGGDVGVRLGVVHAVEKVRDQRPEPVVDMDDVGKEVQRGQHLQNRAAEVDGPRVVVAKSEHPVAVVQRRTVDEVHDHLAQPALEDRRRHQVGAQWHLEVGDDRPQLVAGDFDLAVPRQHDPHVVA